MSIQDIFYTTEKFQRYGIEYFTTVILFFLIGTGLVLYGKNSDENIKIGISKWISFIISSMVVIWAIIEILLGRFHMQSDLPLMFCNFFALILPIFFFIRKQFLFNVLYFIILAGASMAVITPGLRFSFPHYEFAKFWTVHMGLIIFVTYQMIVFKSKPTAKGVLHAFLFVQIYMLIIMLVNWILGSNYLYLNTKPDHGTLLDLLGGWPYYIIWIDIFLIPYFLILYFPVWILQRRKH